MTTNYFRQYITVANFWCYPIRCHVTKYIALEWGLLALSKKLALNIPSNIILYRYFKNHKTFLTCRPNQKNNYQYISYIVLSLCKRPRCTHCESINESTEFLSSNTNEAFWLKNYFNCTSEYYTYLITCKKCYAQYVHQTHQKASKKMNCHRFNICY